MQRSTGFKLTASAAVFVLAAGLVALGIWVGFSIKNRELRERVEYATQSRTLGALFEKEGTDPFTYAYDQPEKASQEMKGYTWSIPVVPTPFVGTAPEPGRHDNSIINQLQFRDRRPLPAPKPEDELRIFLTGGSTAFGVGAPSQDSIVGAYLEDILNRSAPGGQEYRVYTFASPSWSSTHERIAIENRLSEWSPDLIVSLSGNNDVYWALSGRNILWSRTHQEQYFWLMLRALHRAYDSWHLSDVEERQEGPVSPSLVVERLEKNVRLAEMAARMGRGRYLFVLQPTVYWTKKPLTPREAHWRKEDLAAYYEEVGPALEDLLQRLKREGLLTASAADAFDSRPETEEVFLDSVHFGDRGNRLIAQRLAPEVLKALEAPVR
ncbi:MAG TPA: hypothetical protein VLU25_02010 [Acidobacteriota bacterium]|nr:hypothetical protein [Acidobacteriota bacterium]